MATKNPETLKRLICMFLEINCEPSDDQFHALASAIGVDREYLESLVYEMLSDCDDSGGEEEEDQELEEGDELLLADTKEEQVLEDHYDPATTSADDIALNDGEPESMDEDPGLQDVAADDGLGVEDTDLVTVQDNTLVDGIPEPINLGAARGTTGRV